MAEQVFTVKQYRLRAAGPMPIAVGSYAGNLVLHTFMAEVSDVSVYECTQSLPGSSQFRGQGSGGKFISASFRRLGDHTGKYFSGQIVHSPSYVDEGALGFNF
jgi:hypothetical protein